MKCQNLFSGKKSEKYFEMSSAENFAQNAVLTNFSVMDWRRMGTKAWL